MSNLLVNNINNVNGNNCAMSNNNNKHYQTTQMNCSNDDKIVERLPIIVNGIEKYATGLTKRTTVDDVKFAMLSVSDPTFQPEHLNDYGIFEKWQGNERILDGKIKIYKLIRLWQSLPGNQLAQVKFMIKKRKIQAPINLQSALQQQQQQKTHMKLSNRDSNIIDNNKQETTKTPKVKSENDSKMFAFCTFSPAMQKTWNLEKAKRKTSYVQRQLKMAGVKQDENIINSLLTTYTSSTSSSSSSAGSSAAESRSSSYDEQYDDDHNEHSHSQNESSSDVDDDLNSSTQQQEKRNSHKRYASIRRFNRSRKSTIRRTQQIKKSFIDLVTKQNEIIDKQLNKIADVNDMESNCQVGCLRSRSKSLTKFIRSKSLDKCESSKQQQQQQSKSSTLQAATHCNNNQKQSHIKRRDSSCIKSKQNVESIDKLLDDINEKDIQQAFGNGFDSQLLMDDKQANEYYKLCKDYFRVQHSLNSNLKRIEDLKLEINEINQQKYNEAHIEQQQQQASGCSLNNNNNKLAKSINKTSKKLQASIDTTKTQCEKLNDLNSALNRIDDVISLKEKFIQTLEQELQRLENQSNNEQLLLNTVNLNRNDSIKLNNNNQSNPVQSKKSLAYASESSTSSTSSVFTSISSISTSQASANNYNPTQLAQQHHQLQQQKQKINYCNQQPATNQMQMIMHSNQFSSYVAGGDNESDTGISSANSDDFNTQLETLV